MEKKIYIGVLSWKSELEEIEVLKETDGRYMLARNLIDRKYVNKSELNQNTRPYGEFLMFSESKEYIIEQMREFVSEEIEKSNRQILELQNKFQKVLNGIEN